MVGPGFLMIGWQHAAVSLLLCLVYGLLYPQFRERAFRLWIAGWALSSLFGFATGPGPLLVRAVALLATIAGSALLLASIMEWIGWDRRLHYLWPLGLALIGIASLGFVLAPRSVFAWWGAQMLHAGFSIAAGWLLWRSSLRVYFPAMAALSGTMLLREPELYRPAVRVEGGSGSRRRLPQQKTWRHYEEQQTAEQVFLLKVCAETLCHTS